MVADLVWVLLAAPDDEDVVAGPIGFVIFIGLCLAVAFLGWSLTKHLKKAGRAAEEGVYDDPAEAGESDDSRSDATESDVSKSDDSKSDGA